MSRHTDARPNVLLIMADQLGAHTLDRDAALIDTPHLDGIAGDGAVFEHAYVSFPLCVPSRASMLTGRMPHEIGITGNTPASHASDDPATTDPASLGRLLTAAGYDCAYAGKWHATTPSAPPDAGFAVIHPFGDAGLTDSCDRWLGERSESGAPFLLCASFDDPHTICEYARRQPMPYGDIVDGPIRDAPPLPDNFEPAPFEAEAARVEKHRARTVYGTDDYRPDEWRHYRSAYRRLIEGVDRRIGQLLRSVEACGSSRETVILVTSDHGDGDAAHRWSQKTALFQECVRVPLIASGPGIRAGRRRRPVSVGLDLLPTVCALAGIDPPPGHGRPLDLRGTADQDAAQHRPVVVETVFEHGARPSTRGRALVLGGHKYTLYSWGRHREQLHDLTEDPGEQRNLAVESAFDPILERMRRTLLQWCLTTADEDALKYLVLPGDVDPEVRERIFAVPY